MTVKINDPAPGPATRPKGRPPQPKPATPRLDMKHAERHDAAVAAGLAAAEKCFRRVAAAKDPSAVAAMLTAIQSMLDRLVSMAPARPTAADMQPAEALEFIAELLEAHPALSAEILQLAGGE